MKERQPSVKPRANLDRFFLRSKVHEFPGNSGELTKVKTVTILIPSDTKVESEQVHGSELHLAKPPWCL